MRLLTHLIAASCALLSSPFDSVNVHAANAPSTPLPAEAYGRLPAISGAAISPDGTKIVMAVASPEGEQAFRVIDVDTGKSIGGSRVAEAKRAEERSILRDVDWADDGHVTFLQSATYRQNRVLPVGVSMRSTTRLDVWRMGIFDVRTQLSYLLSSDRDDAWGVQLADLTAPIKDEPGMGRLIAASSPYSDGILTLYRVNLANGRAQKIIGGEHNTVDFLLDERGSAVARIDINESTNHWQLFALEKPRARVLLEDTSETGAPPDIAGLLPDGRFAIIDYVDKQGRRVMYAVNPKDATKQVLVASPQYDVGGAIADPWSHRIVGALVQEENAAEYFLEPDLTDALKRAQALDAGASVVLLNWSQDRRRFVIHIERATDAGGYYLFEPATNKVRLIGMAYPDLTGPNVGNRLAIAYPARDGARVSGYLTLPTGREAHNLPTVLLVHGGPSARDTFDFDWWASFLASRGYAVVQPNYRGSDGYGREWERAGYRQWGERMQQDVEDAAVALVRKGIADSTRICIVGASYGGYAALAGATLTPDRYRCAISVAGVSDLPKMLTSVAVRSSSQSMASDWWRMLIGDRSDDRDHLREVSPAYLAERVRVPILLIHGANDVVVPIAQSRTMAAALRAAKKDVRLIEFPGEDHWLSDAPTRIRMLRETEAFLAEHLGR